jgi:hypothetical protein
VPDGEQAGKIAIGLNGKPRLSLAGSLGQMKAIPVFARVIWK